MARNLVITDDFDKSFKYVLEDVLLTIDDNPPVVPTDISVDEESNTLTVTIAQLEGQSFATIVVKGVIDLYSI